MAFATAFMSFGIAIFTYGLFDRSKLLIFVGLAAYLIGLLVTSIVEDRLNTKIKKLEDKLKELKK